MKLTIEIDLDDQAFFYSDGRLAGVLSEIASRALEVEGRMMGEPINIEGRNVGAWSIE